MRRVNSWESSSIWFAADCWQNCLKTKRILVLSRMSRKKWWPWLSPKIKFKIFTIWWLTSSKPKKKFRKSMKRGCQIWGQASYFRNSCRNRWSLLKGSGTLFLFSSIITKIWILLSLRSQQRKSCRLLLRNWELMRLKRTFSSTFRLWWNWQKRTRYVVGSIPSFLRNCCQFTRLWVGDKKLGTKTWLCWSTQ